MSKASKYFMYIINLYIIGTLLLHIIGPIKYYNYEVRDKSILLLFMTFALVIFNIFFWLGSHTKQSSKKIVIGSYKRINLIRTTIYVSTIILILNFIGYVSTKGINFNFANIVNSLSMVYKDNTSQISGGGNIYLKIYIILYFCIPFSFLNVLINYKKISNVDRILTGINLLLFIMINLFFVGSTKMFGDLIVILLFFYFYRIRVDKKNRKKILVWSVIISFTIFVIFGYTISNRIFLWGNVDSVGKSYDLNNFLIRNLNKRMQFAICMAVGYLTQGYYGLAKSLQIPFVWCKGMGSSFFWKDQMLSLFPNMQVPLAYPERLVNVGNWSPKGNWQTIFPWLASDFTFLGAILLLGVMFYYCGKMWKNIESNNNPFRMALLLYFFEIIVFIPANNQIFQVANTFIAFFIYLFGEFFLKEKE